MKRQPSTVAASRVTTVMDRAFMAADLLDEPLVVVPSSTPTNEAVQMMRAQGFDILAVRQTATGTADSWVAAADLNEDVALWKQLKPLLAKEAVERSMPLHGLLNLLYERTHVFVLDGDNVGFILTRADLAKPAVSILVLSYLLAVEQDLIRLSVARLGSEWFSRLPADPQKEAMKIYTKRRKNNAELGLEDCLYFDHVMALTAQAPGLISDLGTTKTQFQALRAKMAPLRNELAHGGSILDGRGTAVEALETVARIRQLVDRAAELVDTSPRLASLYAETRIWDLQQRPLTGEGAVRSSIDGNSWFVVTAYNPGSRTQPPAINKARHHALHQELREAGIHVEEVIAGSVDGLWIEPSLWLRDVTTAFALSLGKRYGQKAIFRVDGTCLTALDVRSGHPLTV